MDSTYGFLPSHFALFIDHDEPVICFRSLVLVGLKVAQQSNSSRTLRDMNFKTPPAVCSTRAK